MKASDIKLLPKHLAVLNDNAKVIHLEGTTGSSKSFILGLKFYFDVFNTSENKKQFVIGASSVTVAEKMFIDNPSSFFNIAPFSHFCTYSKNGTGGSRIEIRTPTGKKIIYLVGYDNKTRYKQILGLGIHGFLIEEIHTAGEEFIRELFTRVYRDDGFLYTSSNGGIPEIPVYQDYLNKARPLPEYANHVPHETMEQLLSREADPDFRFYFFNFYDNPTMTPKQIKALYNSHPKGSWEYNSKIIGIRTNTEGVLYGHLFKNSHIIDQSKLNYGAIMEANIGIDLGGGTKTNNSNRARTVFWLTGFSMRYQRVIVLDTFESKEITHAKIIAEFNEWLYNWYIRLGAKIRHVFPDSADPAFAQALKEGIMLKNILVKPSVKRNEMVTAQTRVSVKEQLIITGRLLWLDTAGALEGKKQLSRVTGKNGETVDENLPHNDYNDAFDYSITARFNYIARGGV